jgi:hypothetical protein
LLQLKNYYRCRYQRSRLPLFHHLSRLLAQVFSTQLISTTKQKMDLFSEYVKPTNLTVLENRKIFYKTHLFRAPLDPSWRASLPHST